MKTPPGSAERWQNNITGTPADIDRYKYGHDLNSNRIWKANVVGTATVTAGLDEFYVMDPLNRLTDMQRGVLNSTTAPTGITGTPSVEQDWTLDPTGNWSEFVTKAAGTTTLDQVRTANTVNEIINITETTGSTWIVPAYDAAGNTTTMPQVADPTQSFTAPYDAWNRMVGISTGTTPIAKYQYDGRNFRIVKNTYASGVLSENRHFYFTAGWQDIEERVGTSTSMDQQYVWGIRYIDELVCRDDATPQRLNATQDANFNLTSISNSSGIMVERYLYDPYGIQTTMNGSWGVADSGAYNWVVGHQGLTIDEESGLIYNRERQLSSQLGTFLRRDPSSYANGMNSYEYEAGSPINGTDWTGRVYAGGGGYGTGGGNLHVPAPPGPNGLNIGVSLELTVGHGGSISLSYVSDKCGNYAWIWQLTSRAGINVGVGPQIGGSFDCITDALGDGEDISAGIGPIGGTLNIPEAGSSDGYSGSGGVAVPVPRFEFPGLKAGVSFGHDWTPQVVGWLPSDLSHPCPCNKCPVRPPSPPPPNPVPPIPAFGPGWFGAAHN
jgi:RHS repeat-associated protein